jgi:putative aminopeptidase FrvX
MATPVPQAARMRHHAWLLELTQLPTAAGHEDRIIDWVQRWAAQRPELELTRDAAGNIHIACSRRPAGAAPVYFTAHMDHPAFVVERILGPGTLQLAFRGGVMEDYFTEARVQVHPRGPGRAPLPATLTGQPQTGCAVFKSYLADLDAGDTSGLRPGDIATWDLPPAIVKDGILYTHACDDLAALAAALAAYDTLLDSWKSRPADPPPQDVRLLLTRAEEVGFIGAIAAARHQTMPKGSKVIALEVSRSFEDSPIGGGPIVRVGDRLSIFCPALTGAIARRAEDIAGGPAMPTASQKLAEHPAWKWQRKLMAGGACEATVFCASGYDATCLCLPLGNYHNMADLTAVQAGTNTARPRVGPEYIALSDFEGLVDLLVACGERLPETPSTRERIDRLWAERAFVLDRPAGEIAPQAGLGRRMSPI